MIEFNPSLSITYKWQKKCLKAYKNEHYASLNEMQILLSSLAQDGPIVNTIPKGKLDFNFTSHKLRLHIKFQNIMLSYLPNEFFDLHLQ